VFETVYRPAGNQAEVGGDFYDVFDLKDGRVALVVGDISGKGMGAARHMAEVKFSLRAYLRSTGSAVAALEYLNADLCRLFGESAADSTTIPGFVCLSLALLDTASGAVEMATAGAEPPLLMRSGSGDAEELIGVPAPPLGAYEDATFVTTDYALCPGDLLLQVTDGITEVRRQNGRANEFLDYEGLIRLVRAALPMGDLGKIGKYVVGEAEAFGGGALRDDACLLLARWDGPAR
jgi:serine phosphatase RsbU (regulator of sigma subunit)